MKTIKHYASILGITAALTLCASMSFAQDKGSGKWVKDGDFVSLGAGFCSQLWVCVPSSSIMHPADQQVGSTSTTSTQGACSVGGGQYDNCNHCLVSPPKERCEWWLERR